MYHGESGVRTLRDLSRSYLAVSKDPTRVMAGTKDAGRWRTIGGQAVMSIEGTHFGASDPRKDGAAVPENPAFKIQ